MLQDRFDGVEHALDERLVGGAGLRTLTIRVLRFASDRQGSRSVWHYGGRVQDFRDDSACVRCTVEVEGEGYKKGEKQGMKYGTEERGIFAEILDRGEKENWIVYVGEMGRKRKAMEAPFAGLLDNCKETCDEWR